MKFKEACQIAIKEEEELKRIHMSNIADHFRQKTNDIKKGMKIKGNEEFTKILKSELREWNDAIQNGRKNGDASSSFKSLENEWKELLKIIREYDIATRIHNRNHQKNRILSIQERLGFVLIPSVNTEE